MCASTAEDLRTRGEDIQTLSQQLTSSAEVSKKLALRMESHADAMMPLFSRVGDSGASNLALKAKELSSSRLVHTAKEASQVGKHLADIARQARSFKGANYKDASVMTKAEHLIDKMDQELIDGQEMSNHLDAMIASVVPPPPFFNTSSAARNYYPVLYFIDKKFDGIEDPVNKDDLPGVPTTCTGNLVGLPIIGKNKEECAQACDDNLVHGCKAFQYFNNDAYKGGKGKSEMCFLFSDFSTGSGFYYTGCKGSQTNSQTGCWVKFAKFAGGKFDGSGTLNPEAKCKECFREFTKADRCYTK